MMRRLSNATLNHLSPSVRRPAYDRRNVTPGIVHLGVGNFHRAHQALYTDDCLAAGQTDWGIVAASLRNPDTRDALNPQDGLYAILTRQDEESSLRVVGAIDRVLVAPEDPQALLEVLCDERVRVVTLTITEKGYTADLAARRLLVDHPDIMQDLAHPADPRSAVGYLAEALARRLAASLAPFTVLSCDNLPSNGATLRKIMLEFATERDPVLARHIGNDVAFPSSMVDRIVPATTDAVRAAVTQQLGVEDAWPVVTEPFIQWVIENNFTAGRPDWEISGAQFVSDVIPFEHMKLRLLNGSHTALAAIGRLAGLSTVDQAIANPIVRGFIEDYWTEAIATVPAELEPANYTAALRQRYANSSLGHRTEQIATDASQKVPQRILAPLLELRRRGLPHAHLVMAIAVWIRSCAGVDDHGMRFAVNDPTLLAWSGLPDQAERSDADIVAAFIGNRSIFGDELPQDPELAASLVGVLRSVRQRGVLSAISPKG